MSTDETNNNDFQQNEKKDVSFSQQDKEDKLNQTDQNIDDYMDEEFDDGEDHRPSYQKKRVIVPSITAIIFLIIGIYFMVHGMHFQSTDDAFVEGHIVSIAPRVAGPVKEMLITDNQPVKKGDLLIVIDPNDYEAKLEQTKAKLAQVKASLKISEDDITRSKSGLEASGHDVVSTRSKLDFSQKDYKRYSAMYKEGISSKQEYDNSKTGLTVAKAAYKSAVENERAAKAMLESAKAKREATLADIQRLEAEVKTDELNLSYTKIYAPEDGLITNRSVEQGNYVQVAQPMFAIVPETVWIVANFKETQLTYMKPGQDVKVKIDTYPGKKFKARVDSIQRATGAKASLFPPENAVGSYVKIVQRVPVKIVFTEDISKYNIVPGMSVVPEVKVR